MGMQLRCERPDGKKFTAEVNDIKEVIPCQNFYTSENIAPPYIGLIPYRSSILPVTGSAPRNNQLHDLWLLVYADHAELIRGIPELEGDPERANQPALKRQVA